MNEHGTEECREFLHNLEELRILRAGRRTKSLLFICNLYQQHRVKSATQISEVVLANRITKNDLFKVSRINYLNPLNSKNNKKINNANILIFTLL